MSQKSEHLCCCDLKILWNPKCVGKSENMLMSEIRSLGGTKESKLCLCLGLHMVHALCLREEELVSTEEWTQSSLEEHEGLGFSEILG